ncbi:hypothetical protein ALP17_200070 [Pseudomonas savastanoi]|uniref:Uncharacterized protein n=1 Tax=Pseudomonas savastanoi TaxID=29438 RepID=A0A3M5ZQH8_PSESS|nr:hypothetical protein ALP17_200070 [Pseudomonas savastanoi]
MTFAQPVIMAVAFKGSIRPLQTLITVGETARVVIVLKIRLRLDMRRPFHVKTRFFKVIITASGAVGAGFQAQLETLDDRLIGHQTIVPAIKHRIEFRKH